MKVDNTEFSKKQKRKEKKNDRNLRLRDLYLILTFTKTKSNSLKLASVFASCCYSFFQKKRLKNDIITRMRLNQYLLNLDLF